MSEWERLEDSISKETASHHANLLSSCPLTTPYSTDERVPTGRLDAPTRSQQNSVRQNSLQHPQHTGLLAPMMLSVRCWGVCGEIPSANSREYGGNTSCVEVSIADQRIIFDAGTGLSVLGYGLAQAAEQTGPFRGDIFLSSSQWGRTQGLSFFQPAFHPRNQLNVYGPVAITGASIKHQLMDQMRLPLSAMSLREMRATLAFHDVVPATRVRLPAQSDWIEAQSLVQPGAIQVEAQVINPQTRAMGYRLSWCGLTVVYGTAFDLDDEQSLQTLLDLSQSADLLIYGAADVSQHLRSPLYSLSVQAQYREQQYRQLLKHLSPVNVRQILLTRHPPLCGDEQLQTLEALLHQQDPRVSLARENAVIQLHP